MKIKMWLCFFSIFVLLPAFGNPVVIKYSYESAKSSQYCLELRGGATTADPAFINPTTRPMKYFRPFLNAYIVLRSNFLGLDGSGNNKLSMSVLEGKILAKGDQHQKGKIGGAFSGDAIEVPNVGSLLNWVISPTGEIIKHENILGNPDTKSVLHKELKPYYYFTELATRLMFVKLAFREQWNVKPS